MTPAPRRLLDLLDLLDAARADGACDVNLWEGHTPFARIDSAMVDLDETALTVDELGSLLRTLAGPVTWAKLKATRTTTDFAVNGTSGRFRCLAHWDDAHGLQLTLRVIPDTIPTLDSLTGPGRSLRQTLMAPLARR